MATKACRLPSKYDTFQVGQGSRYDKVGWVVFRAYPRWRLSDKVYGTRRAACVAAGKLNRAEAKRLHEEHRRLPVEW
jgi:hypothetical protein